MADDYSRIAQSGLNKTDIMWRSLDAAEVTANLYLELT
jgi:hypothetical protein